MSLSGTKRRFHILVDQVPLILSCLDGLLVLRLEVQDKG